MEETTRKTVGTLAKDVSKYFGKEFKSFERTKSGFEVRTIADNGNPDTFIETVYKCEVTHNSVFVTNATEYEWKREKTNEDNTVFVIKK